MKLLLAGDTHGYQTALDALDRQAQAHGCEMIIQVGDFGFWPRANPGFPARRLTTPLLWLDGNHEDHQAMMVLDMGEWGQRTNCHYQPRGTVREIGGLRCLFIGGASSIDKHRREEGRDWFMEENITREDIDACLEYQGEVDVVFAHEVWEGAEPCPRISGDVAGARNRRLLTEVRERWPDAWWFNGHWHILRQRQRHLCLPKLDLIWKGDDPASCIALIFDTEERAVVDSVRIYA